MFIMVRLSQVRRNRHFNFEEGDSPRQRYYPRLILIPLSFNSNPYSNESVHDLQGFPEKPGLKPTSSFSCGPNEPISSNQSVQDLQRDSNPRLVFLAVPMNPLAQIRVSRTSRGLCKNRLSLGLKPTTIFLCGPNQPIKVMSYGLVGTAEKNSRVFESQAEMIFPKTSGDPGHWDRKKN